MATLADRLKKTVYRGRAIAGSLGFRITAITLLLGHRESIRKRAAAVVRIPIVEANNQPPRARPMKDEEVAVGGLASGTWEIGPITPLFSGGGTDITKLQGKGLAPGDDRLILLEGPAFPNGALFEITSIVAQKALRIMVQCKPVEQGETF
jgi:hypothetical protein